MLDDLHSFLRQFPSLTEEERAAIAEKLSVHQLFKGTILLREGEISTKCYFILRGCIRQFVLGADGKEQTIEFFTEQQAVVLFSSYGHSTPSRFGFVCAEDCTAIVGDVLQEHAMYEEFPALQAITRSMMEQDLGALQEKYASFVRLSPEERYQHLLETRPSLLQRAPQHQIASYLGVTPESLSRIRKRLVG